MTAAITRKQRDFLQALVRHIGSHDGVVELDGVPYVYGRQVASSKGAQAAAQQLHELGIVTRAEAPGSRRVVVWGVRSVAEACALIGVEGALQEASTAEACAEEPSLDTTPRRVVLVSCGAQKLDHAAPARDLYTGTLTRDRIRYAEASGELWLIVSARHHLVWPDRVLEPYDFTLDGLSADFRRAWSRDAAHHLIELLGERGIDARSCTVELHMSGHYAREVALALRSEGVAVECPTEGFTLPKCRAWYSSKCAKASPELAEVIASEPDLQATQEVSAAPAQVLQVQAPQDPHAEACDWIRSLLETSGDKREVLPSWDRWRAHQSLPAPLETALGLALRYRVAHQLHTASPVEDQRTHRRREQGLWDATLKSLDLAAALVAAPLDEDDPQEDQAPAPTPTLADVLTPSPPVLKRCASSARGSVCGVEAHTEEEVERLFGWRWITADVDHPRRLPQGQCKACKSAHNAKHGKARTARRSQPAAPDLRQADLLQELPPPPPRPDYFARLRSICGLVIDGQWIGEGITTSRPPKLEAGDPERLLVTCEAGALRCTLSPLGEWTVKAEERPKLTPTQLSVWARAAAVVSVALEIDAHAHISDGPGLTGLEWTRFIKAAREEVKP